MSTYDLENMPRQANVAPGLASFALVAKKSDFTSIAGIAVPTGGTVLEDTVKIKSNHVFAAGRKFSKWALAKDKNSMESTPDGDPGFRQFKHAVTVFLPGSTAVLHATMAALLNDDLIVLVRDANCGSNMYYQMGNECNPASINPKFTTATTSGGIKGYEVTIESSGPSIQIYEGSIGILDDDTNEPVTLTFAAATTAADGGVSVTVPVVDADVEFGFTKQGVPTGADKTMTIKVAAALEATVTFKASYLGTEFTFTDAAAVTHSGFFTAAEVSYT